MRAVAVFSVIFSFLTTATYADCQCSEEPIDYLASSSEEVGWMEEFDWRVTNLRPVYDLTQPEEPTVSCEVTVELIYEDDPVYDLLVIGDEDQLVYQGRWLTFDEFEGMAEANQCQDLTS